MPVLRLFAAAREAAGTAVDEVPGVTVDDVLDGARARYGPVFADVLAASRVWRNGEPATGDEPVGPGDEVAVLPPVSGGSDVEGGDEDGHVLTRTRAVRGMPPPPTPAPDAVDTPAPSGRRRGEGGDVGTGSTDAAPEGDRARDR